MLSSPGGRRLRRASFGLLSLAVLAAATLLARGLLAKLRQPSPAGQAVTATVETEPVPHAEDAADDPAVWVDPTDPSSSTVIGTDKKGGIAVYDLAGRQIQYRPDGHLNNVDLRDRFPLGGRTVTLVTAGNRTDNSVAVYRVEVSTRTLRRVRHPGIRPGLSTYGSCMYHSRVDGRFYYFVTGDSGAVEQWRLLGNRRGEVSASRVRRFEVGSAAEGCVADDELGHLYVAEETKGIWRYGAEPAAGARRALVDSADPGGRLVADVEGLALAAQAKGRGYLLASSQGNSSFSVYRRGGDNDHVASFHVGAGRSVDAVEDTDGIDVTTAPLGSTFPRGVFVAQDGDNRGGNQNFKLVPWQAIRALADSADLRAPPRG